MPRFIEKHNKQTPLQVDPDRLSAFTTWLEQEITDSLSSRRQLDKVWRAVLKMYNGVPKMETRNVPIPNAPNIEVTVGAIAADTIFAQAVDLVFNTTPLATVRPKPKFKGDEESVKDAQAMQVFVNHIAASEEAQLRDTVETAILDDIQLGTGVIYTPYVQKTKKTKTAKILSAGPRFHCVPAEDVIVPGGSKGNFQELPFFGLRFYYTLSELVDSAKANKWNIEGIQPISAKDWVRTAREILGRQQENVSQKGTLVDVIKGYAYFDIDGDGIDEDLFFVWNQSGSTLMYLNYSPEDNRPVEKMVYQKQAHLFYGLGVLQMMMPYEEKLSDIHNFATLNILLANSRLFIGSEALDETMQIWPGKYIQVPDASKDFRALQMADVYNSIWQDQMITMQLANQRVGISDTGQGGNIPSRTPGITMMTAIQQVKRRFTPAFDGMRACIAASLRQACYRYQERLLSGDQKAMLTIYEILGYEQGNRVISTLRNTKFDEHYDMELTASSASVNREADRQNSIMLTNILSQYYQRTIELVMLSANPQTPPEVATIAKKIAASAGEIIDRTIRTFDQVRDPSTFVIDIENELNNIKETSDSQQGLEGLMQMLGGGEPTGPEPPQLPPPAGV